MFKQKLNLVFFILIGSISAIYYYKRDWRNINRQNRIVLFKENPISTSAFVFLRDIQFFYFVLEKLILSRTNLKVQNPNIFYEKIKGTIFCFLIVIAVYKNGEFVHNFKSNQVEWKKTYNTLGVYLDLSKPLTRHFINCLVAAIFIFNKKKQDLIITITNLYEYCIVYYFEIGLKFLRINKFFYNCKGFLISVFVDLRLHLLGCRLFANYPTPIFL